MTATASSRCPSARADGRQDLSGAMVSNTPEPSHGKARGPNTLVSHRVPTPAAAGSHRPLPRHLLVCRFVVPVLHGGVPAQFRANARGFPWGLRKQGHEAV